MYDANLNTVLRVFFPHLDFDDLETRAVRTKSFEADKDWNANSNNALTADTESEVIKVVETEAHIAVNTARREVIRTGSNNLRFTLLTNKNVVYSMQTLLMRILSCLGIFF